MTVFYPDKILYYPNLWFQRLFERILQPYLFLTWKTFRSCIFKPQYNRLTFSRKRHNFKHKSNRRTFSIFHRGLRRMRFLKCQWVLRQWVPLDKYKIKLEKILIIKWSKPIPNMLKRLTKWISGITLSKQGCKLLITTYKLKRKPC